jgi:arylsulfatase A-like enzyme
MPFIRSFLTAALTVLSILTVQGAGERPNVILIMCDDLGWGDVGFNGNTVIKTPELDRMAASGLRFERFYSASAVCSPTRGSVLTGRNPMRLGIPTANAGHLQEKEFTLAEHLGRAGYRTGHFGKWHLGTLTRDEVDSNRGGRPRHESHFTRPSDHGFDTWFSTEAKVPTYDPMIKPVNHPARLWWDPVTDPGMAESYGTAYWGPDGKVSDNLRGDNSRIIMDRAIPFISDAARSQRNFLAVIWFHTPHLPVVAGPEMTALYAEASDYQKHYYGSITAMDRQVGRLRAHLQELGVADNTMIWFCSDNGPEGQKGQAPGSAGPFSGRKRDLLEGGIRVPALLEWPSRVDPGQSTALPCFTSDYLPTILEWAGLPFENTVTPLDGISLAPLIEAGLHHRPVPMAFEFGNQKALTLKHFKLHMRGDRISLFNIERDPSESTDISGQFPILTAQLHDSLLRWSAECGAERTILKNPEQ